MQKKYGGDPEKCVVCQYYNYFFEPDDKKLKEIFDAERAGTMLAGEHKQHLADTINKYLAEHKKRKQRAADKLDEFLVRD